MKRAPLLLPAIPVLLALSACRPADVAPAPAAVHAPAVGAAARLPAPGEVSHIDAELAVRRLGSDAFLVTHEPFFASNVLVARMPDGTAVICSSPYETQAARALVKWVRAALRPSRIVAINTHFHFDGTGGNEAYRELGVETYASNLTIALQREKGPKVQAESAMDFKDPAMRKRVEAMVLVPAEHVFSEKEGLTLTFGGEAVRVIYPGAAHTQDNMVVYFPSRNLLFGGCMIKGSRSVGFIGHADLGHWEAAVDAVRPLGARVVVPGHGAVGGPELFDLTVTVVHDALAQQER